MGKNVKKQLSWMKDLREHLPTNNRKPKRYRIGNSHFSFKSFWIAGFSTGGFLA
jgi:hypothetical protein